MQEDSCCTDPHRWMKPLLCPQDFLDADVCALHFVGWRKTGMPAVYEVRCPLWACDPLNKPDRMS